MPRFVAVLLVLLLPLSLRAQDLPTIETYTDGFEKLDGFFPLYWDAGEGKIWLEIPRFDEDFLYVVSLPAGLGSNDVGLDRGQLGGERVVYFERVGPKVLLVEPNLRYQAVTDNAAERQSVADAFAPSVVWGFTVAAATDGRVLVDATDFIVRDAHGVARQLQQTGQGSFSLDGGRSVPHLPMTKAFPQNTEMEARLTFTSSAPGGYVRSVAANPYAITLRVRHSFVQLPGPGYTPRVLHPRSGFFGMSYQDYAVPIGEDMTQRFINRHRLQCAGPVGDDGLCDPVEPIVYYLDPGTPEPVRSALLDGARWWAEAFEAAGFRDAYRVEMLPEDADPMDVRYNVIQWIHRSTRGWSYGSAVTDPRTGEIIKGHVSLGSLRVRQDYLLAEGLLAPYTGDNANGLPAENDPMLAMALARIRQLSAHEVGHTLGIAHNFAASVNNRASVMDYPAPLATLDANGDIDLSEAYATGVGAWDIMAVRYGYTPLDNEAAGLAEILEEMNAAGLHYITDSDARPTGGAHPLAHLWDNGTDAVDALEREMAVREVALANFSDATIRADRPLALLEEVLVPLYLRHRYQVEGTVKLLGGVDYSYAMRGDQAAPPSPIAPEAQTVALDALLATITPEALRLPEAARQHIPPRPPGHGANRELFDGYTGLTFDPYAPAETAASMVLSLLIHPQRAARLMYQHDFDDSLPGLFDVLDRIDAQVWDRAPADAYDAELQRLVQQVWTDVLLQVATRDDGSPAVQARVQQNLRDRLDWLTTSSGMRSETMAHRASLADQIARFLNRDFNPEATRETPTTPPGSPIGHEAAGFWHRQVLRHATLDRHVPLLQCGF